MIPSTFCTQAKHTHSLTHSDNNRINENTVIEITWHKLQHSVGTLSWNRTW